MENQNCVLNTAFNSATTINDVKHVYLLSSLHFDSFLPTVNPLVSIHGLRSSIVLPSKTFCGKIAPATSLS